MPQYYRMAAIFSTRIIRGAPFKAIFDPSKIEIVDGPVSYKVPGQFTRVHIIGEGERVISDGDLDLPKGKRFIVITARSKTLEKQFVHDFQDIINTVITKISIAYQPQIFFEQVYMGPLLGPYKKFYSMFVRPANSITIVKQELEDQLKEMRKHLSRDNDLLNRFTLMSRFYSKSLAFDPGEEKFLMQWTALEIFPMKDTSDIRPLRKLLAGIVGCSVTDISNKLQLGRLYGKRCDLVHHGKLAYAEYEDTFRKLEAIVHEVMRHMCGQKYSGLLDRYLTDL